MDESKLIKGRGATINPKPRFLSRTTIPVDDGWDFGKVSSVEFPESAPQTNLLADKTRNLITTNQSPDIPFNQSINPYKGCEHGCIYCFARPTHAFLDLSPGLDFETQIFYKTNPVERLQEALENPNYKCEPIALGTNTDPYQPAEKQLRITRRILETLLEYRHPVSIVTKGVLILRDMDLLQDFARLELVSVAVSVTTLNNGLKTRLEPRTASPKARLRIIGELAGAGIPVGVIVAPVIPMLNDHELEQIIQDSVDEGAGFAGYIMIRLPLEVRPLFEEWLEEHYPLKALRIMNRIRDLHRGREYTARFGERMRGTGMYAELMQKRFALALRKHGLPSLPKRSEVDRGELGLFANTRGSGTLRTDLFRRRNELSFLFED